MAPGSDSSHPWRLLGCFSGWHPTGRALRHAHLASRASLAFAISALLCYLPGVIPGTSYSPVLANSYISLVAMIVFSPSLGETTKHGVQSSLGAGLAAIVSFGLEALGRASQGAFGKLGAREVLSTGAALTFIIVLLMQLAATGPDTQKISIMLIGQAIARIVIDIMADTSLSSGSWQVADFPGVVIGCLVAAASLMFPFPVLASAELGKKLQAAMRQLSHCHIVLTKLILMHSQHPEEQADVSPSMTKMFALDQLDLAASNLQALPPLFGNMWWEVGMSPALRRTIRQIIEHQQASLEWLKAMMRVNTLIESHHEKMGKWYAAILGPIGDDLMRQSVLLWKSSAVVSSFVLGPTQACGPCCWRCHHGIAPKLQEITDAMQALKEGQEQVQRSVIASRNRAAEKVLNSDLAVMAKENAMGDAALFFSARIVSRVLLSLQECEAFGSAASRSWPCAAFCMSMSDMASRLWASLKGLFDVSRASLQFSFRVAVAMTLALLAGATSEGVGSKVSFHTAMLIAGGGVEKTGTIKVSVHRVLGAMIAINTLPLIMSLVPGDGWIAPVVVGTIWMFAMRYNELESQSSGYAFKMASFAATSVLVNYDFYIVDNSASYLTFVTVVYEVTFAAVIVILCEILIFPRSGQKLTLFAIHDCVGVCREIFSSLQDTIETLTPEEEPLSWLPAAPEETQDDSIVGVSTEDAPMDPLAKPSKTAPPSQIADVEPPSPGKEKSTGKVTDNRDMLRLMSIQVDLHRGNPANRQRAENLLKQLTCKLAILKQRIASLDGDPCFGQFVPEDSVFTEVHKALSSLSVWASVSIRLVSTGFATLATNGAPVSIVNILTQQQLRILVPCMASITAMFRHAAMWQLLKTGKHPWAPGGANQVLDECREASVPVDEAFAALTAAKADTEQQLLLILHSIMERVLHMPAQPRLPIAAADSRMLQLTPVHILSGLVVCTRGLAQSASTVLRALHRMQQTYTSHELHAKAHTLVLGSTGAAAFASLESLELPDNLEGILAGEADSGRKGSTSDGPVDTDDEVAEAAEEVMREEEQRDMAVVTAHACDDLVEEEEGEEEGEGEDK